MKLICLFTLSLLILCHAKPFKVEWSTLLKASVNTKPLDPPDITNCTKPTDEGEINSVTFDPAEPKAGDTVTIEASFFLKENVTKGTITVSADFDGQQLYSGDLNLCDVAKEVGLPCPLLYGAHNFKVELQIPSIAPTGTYSGKGVITDQNDKEVACGEGTYKL